MVKVSGPGKCRGNTDLLPWLHAGGVSARDGSPITRALMSSGLILETPAALPAQEVGRPRAGPQTPPGKHTWFLPPSSLQGSVSSSLKPRAMPGHTLSTSQVYAVPHLVFSGGSLAEPLQEAPEKWRAGNQKERKLL